ncbi:TraR/DksA C4-type zinc finger protein [Chromobacterium sp. S0633]|uniref:TraR/DksA C4-type zinc finger protein n=1 Tax=Chromobacterium sp. S0633 TaxID=2957805 RepID=UPI0020A0C5D1|nr:TraR/DksA C4-type zinc finger protein [Chromobacterium sp. S0633]MCP1289764.1 TraR/DksA C4-type zinc finger protein [Chromobacterium sp. S0633]
MDDFDRAQELEAFQREMAIAAALNRGGAESLAECDDCGGDIPHARRLAAPGCTRCIHCQERHEQRLRGYA